MAGAIVDPVATAFRAVGVEAAVSPEQAASESMFSNCIRPIATVEILAR